MAHVKTFQEFVSSLNEAKYIGNNRDGKISSNYYNKTWFTSNFGDNWTINVGKQSDGKTVEVKIFKDDSKKDFYSICFHLFNNNWGHTTDPKYTSLRVYNNVEDDAYTALVDLLKSDKNFFQSLKSQIETLGYNEENGFPDITINTILDAAGRTKDKNNILAERPGDADSYLTKKRYSDPDDKGKAYEFGKLKSSYVKDNWINKATGRRKDFERRVKDFNDYYYNPSDYKSPEAFKPKK